MRALEDLLLKTYQEPVDQVESVVDAPACLDATAAAELESTTQTTLEQEHPVAPQSVDEPPAAEAFEAATELTEAVQEPSDDSATARSTTEVPIAEEFQLEDSVADPAGQPSVETIEVVNEAAEDIHWTVEIAAKVPIATELAAPPDMKTEDGLDLQAVVEQPAVEDSAVTPAPTDEIEAAQESASRIPLATEEFAPADAATVDSLDLQAVDEKSASDVAEVTAAPTDDTETSTNSASKTALETEDLIAPAVTTEDSVAPQTMAESPAIEGAEVTIELADDVQEPIGLVAETPPAAEAPAPQDPTTEAQTPDETTDELKDVDSRIEGTDSTTFKAQWEVDRFLWPDFCLELEAEISPGLSAAIEQIEAEYKSQSIDAVIITAAQQGSGRTTMTLCLAREAARQGKSVVVVDLDHQTPALMDQLGVGVEEGIESVGRADVTGDSICIKAIEDGITLVPLTSAIDSARCLDERVQELLALVSATHDMVLIDTSAEVAELLSSRAAQLRFGAVVVDDKRVAANLFRNEIIDRVRGENCHAVGIIENFAA